MNVIFLSLCLLPLQGPIRPDDPREEIKKLFESIEKDLKEIDRLLLDAGAEDSKSKMEQASSKMGELLKEALGNQKKVTQAIEEILKKLPPDGGGGSGSQSPKDKTQGSSSQEKEKERDKVPEKPDNVQPDDPKDNKDSQKSGQNRTGKPPKPPKSDTVDRDSLGGRWGDLPPLYQELFRNQKTDDIPVRYRKWIEDYYRRMNKAKP